MSQSNEDRVRILLLGLGGTISDCWSNKHDAFFDQKRAEEACADTARTIIKLLGDVA